MYQVESLLGNQVPDVRLLYVRLASPSVFVDRGRVSQRSRITFERNELTSHLEFWAKMVTLGPHRGDLVGVDEGS